MIRLVISKLHTILTIVSHDVDTQFHSGSKELNLQAIYRIYELFTYRYVNATFLQRAAGSEAAPVFNPFGSYIQHVGIQPYEAP